MMFVLGKFSIFTLADKIYVGISALLSALIGWTFTGDIGYTILAAALGAIITALPKIITALSGARKSTSEILHAEIATLARALAEERDTVRLVRISKHNFQSELQKCSFHIDYLEEILKQHQIDHQTIQRLSFDQLTTFEDKGIEHIFKKHAS